MWLTPKPDGGSTNSRGETCRQLRHRHRSGIESIGRRAVGILSILQDLTICEFFLRVRAGLGCLEKNLQPTGGGVNSTPTNTTRTELHSMITFHHANTRGSRAAKLRIAHLCVAKQLSSACHVSFLSPYLSQLSDDLINTHKTFGSR